jgi:hypothetical protein
MSWLELPTAMRTRLLSSTTITGAVAQRVHYQELPQDSALPHVWFRRQGRSSDDCMDWDDEGIVEERYAIEVVSDRDAEDLVDDIVSLLRSWRGTIGDRYLQLVEIEDADDDYVFVSVGAAEPDYLHALQVILYHAAA